MNKAQLKAYAPQARKDFIQSMIDQAALYGIEEDNLSKAQINGDVAIINGKSWSAEVGRKQKLLVLQIEADGFYHTMETLAYSWFNRLTAIRYMELKGVLTHGYRVLSHPDQIDTPEILEHAEEIELDGLDTQKAIDLKLDGNKDQELYRMLLLAQCNELHQSMPFLFEKIDDATELLLPNNLLQTDSLIRKLVQAIDEDNWKQIEIIGWLYQFYISEKKDLVIGKVVKQEDIPAATQLFTPRWIVEYMVQNSLGRKWLMTYPDSPLQEKMKFYIEPAEQSEEVQQQLKDITPEELNPEELTLLDPACGSGHILVVAYDIFREIYLERGYQLRKIPSLILEKNLFGLDIDQRAAQMSGFALLMKAHEDDSRILKRGIKLNVCEILESSNLKAEQLHLDLFETQEGSHKEDLEQLVESFSKAKNLGSLLSIPESLSKNLTKLEEALEEKGEGGSFLEIHAKEDVQPLVQIAKILVQKYDTVVANPPYMGVKGMNAELKSFAKKNFPNSKSDVFAMFIEQSFNLLKVNGYNALITMQSWMFLSSFEKLRHHILEQHTILTLAQIGYNSFPTLNSKIAQAVTFICQNINISSFKGNYVDLNSAPQSADKHEVFLNRDKNICYELPQRDFKKIPNSPIAYWVSEKIRNSFLKENALENFSKPVVGLQTGDNDLFIRFWHEVMCNSINDGENPDVKSKWFPYVKGGDFRKWYGNNYFIVDWENNGSKIKEHKSSRPQNRNFYFKSGISYTNITSSFFAARYTKKGSIFDQKGSMFFSQSSLELFYTLGLLHSNVCQLYLKILCPTIDFNPGSLSKIPFIGFSTFSDLCDKCVKQLVTLSQKDWNSFEISWDFKNPPLLYNSTQKQSEIENILNTNPQIYEKTVEQSFFNWQKFSQANIAEMKNLEEENNRIFIDAYDLQGELIPDVPEEQITLTVNPKYRYRGNLSEEEGWTRFREDSIKELLSYAIGCMMGRYSLDQAGLVYAEAGNVNFDESKYNSFPADDDGIVPMLDMDWGFEDDSTIRVEEFLKTAWDEETREENLKFVASAFKPKTSETAKDTIRRYLSTGFFKDHLQTYKNRPIYWLFSSGKNRAFEALVYLHRYNESTLARMRTEYVIPLQSKFSARIQVLETEISKSDSTTLKKKYQSELKVLEKKRVEIVSFDEQLRHYADQRITLDLDDGVKVNYDKFGPLLAEVKKVTGKK